MPAPAEHKLIEAQEYGSDGRRRHICSGGEHIRGQAHLDCHGGDVDLGKQEKCTRRQHDTTEELNTGRAQERGHRHFLRQDHLCEHRDGQLGGDHEDNWRLSPYETN